MDKDQLLLYYIELAKIIFVVLHFLHKKYFK